MSDSKHGLRELVLKKTEQCLLVICDPCLEEVEDSKRYRHTNLFLPLRLFTNIYRKRNIVAKNYKIENFVVRRNDRNSS